MGVAQADARERGQMTVELAVVFPALLAVAVIAVNALLFFSECAAFDRVAREAVRLHAASPAYGQGLEQSCAQVAQTVEQALVAQADGADYLGVGAVFGTPTKPDAADVGTDGLAAICAAVDIPVVAIGGLNERTIPELAGTGADGAAVVSAIFAAEDIEEETRRLRAAVQAALGA